jgi:cell division transport system permease protein
MKNSRAAARRDGASQSRTRLGDQYAAWLRHHRLSAADSLYRVMDKPFSSVLTWLVIGIALALPVGFNVALDNLGQLGTRWDSPTRISLFLRHEVSVEQARELDAALARRADVGSTQLVSRDQALQEFQSRSGFADVLGSLEQNPLPHLILVSPVPGTSPEQLKGLRAHLQGLPEAGEAVVDMAWVRRLSSLMELSRRLVLAVGGLLVLGVVLILGNTIRLAIESRREEILIVKLVGGSNSFVRRPFLYTGLWYGVGGGVIAALLVGLGLWFLQEPVGELVRLYGSDFRLQGLGIMGALNLVVLGGLLGLAGAWLAVSRHLVHIEPR